MEQGKRHIRQFNGFMAFSNDLYPIIGQTRIRGLWPALGVWVTHSGGVLPSSAGSAVSATPVASVATSEARSAK